MKSISAIWFECKVRYDKTQENGLQKKVTEQYVVQALSFAEAEHRIIEEMAAYISGEYEVTDVKKTPYKEVFFMGNGEKIFNNEVEELNRAVRKGDKEKADKVLRRPLEEKTNTDSRYYKAKLQFITIDEKTGKEKHSNVTYLVEATSLHNALDNIDTVMRGTMTDYVQVNVNETQILEVYSYDKKADLLMRQMVEDLRDPSKSVEEIADKYVHTTPELRQQLIDKLTEMRKEKSNGNEGE